MASPLRTRTTENRCPHSMPATIPISRIKVAVIGVGLIGPRHAKTVQNSADTELCAIVDPMPNGAKFASEMGTSHYHTVEDLLDSPDRPDAAIICTPNATHVAIAKELASAGINMIVEKPISTDIESGRDLVKHAAMANIKLLVGHHRRFNPYMVAAKEAVDSGSLGTILALSGTWATYKPDDYFDPPATWRRFGTGGVILINLIHEIDLMHYLLGPITRIHAEKTLSTRGYDAEEGAAITLRFKGGAVGTFILLDNAPSPYNFESGTGENPLIPRTGQDFYRIFGTEAALSVPDMTRWSYNGAPIKSWHSPLNQENLDVGSGVPFDLQLAHFVKVIRGEMAPSCTAKAGLAALIVCDAVKRALEHNGTVEIDDYEL